MFECIFEICPETFEFWALTPRNHIFQLKPNHINSNEITCVREIPMWIHWKVDSIDFNVHERAYASHYECGYWLPKLNGIFPFFIAIFFGVWPIWTRTYRPSNWSLQSAPFERRADLGKTTKKHFFSVYVLLCKEQFNLSLRECVRACVCFVYVFWHNTVWSPQIQMIKNFDNSYSTEHRA